MGRGSRLRRRYSTLRCGRGIIDNLSGAEKKDKFLFAQDGSGERETVTEAHQGDTSTKVLVLNQKTALGAVRHSIVMPKRVRSSAPLCHGRFGNRSNFNRKIATNSSFLDPCFGMQTRAMRKY